MLERLLVEAVYLAYWFVFTLIVVSAFASVVAAAYFVYHFFGKDIAIGVFVGSIALVGAYVGRSKS